MLFVFSKFFLVDWLGRWFNECGWCLAGSRGSLLKGPHLILSVSWILHLSLHFHIHLIALDVPSHFCLFYCLCKHWGEGIYMGGGKGGREFTSFSFLCVLFFVSSCLWSLSLGVLEKDGVVLYSSFLLISLSSVPLTRRYCCSETVVLVFCFSIVSL